MKLVMVSQNKYIKMKDDIELSLIEDIDNIYEILKNNSDGENSHNHNSIYYTKDNIDLMLKGYSQTKHSHDNLYYSKDETLQIIQSLISDNKPSDEIHVSRTAPSNNEKLWFRIVD